jgi:hypothetical protein
MSFHVASEKWLEVKGAQWSKANLAIQNYNLAHLNSYFGRMLLTADLSRLHWHLPGTAQDRASQPSHNQYGIRHRANDLEMAEAVGRPGG